MAGFRSVEDVFLDKKVSKLEEDLIKFKAAQRYGMKNVQIFESNNLSRSSHTYPASSYDEQFHFTASGTDIYKVRFVGNKPSKTVVGSLRYNFSNVTGPQTWANPIVSYMKGYRGGSPNVLEWIIAASGGNDSLGDTYTTFDLNLWALTNEQGSLSIVETYSIDTYYHWILG